MVTVAIVAHNESLRLFSCLSSLIDQENISEVLILDNASTDNTIEVARSFADLHPKIKIKIMRLETNNMGFARAMAVTTAKTDLLAFLDADCVAEKNWLQQLLADWQESYAALGGPINFCYGTSVFSRTRAKLHRTWLGHLGSEQIDHSGGAVGTREHLPTANVLYRREAVLRVGNFSSAFARVCEDVDLSLRLRHAGYQLGWTPKAGVDHHQQEGWWNWTKRTFRYGKGQASARGRRFWNWPNRLRWPVIFSPILWLGFPIYFVALCFESVRVSKKFSEPFSLIALLALTHACYFAGLLAGLILPMSNQSRPLKSELPTMASI